MPRTVKNDNENITNSVNDKNTTSDYEKKILELEAKMKKLDDLEKEYRLKIEAVDKEKQEEKKEKPVFENGSGNFEEEIHPNKKTKLTSLCYGAVTLYHPTHGFIKLKQYGDSVSISFSRLCDYMMTCGDCFKNGIVFIHDQKMVDSFDLTEQYQDLLSVNIVKDILQGNFNNYSDVLSSSSKSQKESFANLLAEKLSNGEFDDFNIVEGCSKALGIDIRKISNDIQKTKEKLT